MTTIDWVMIAVNAVSLFAALTAMRAAIAARRMMADARQTLMREHDRRNVDLLMNAALMDQLDNVAVNIRENFAATNGTPWREPRRGSYAMRVRQLSELYERSANEANSE